uniref:NADH-ubiquinone oxidoreductase chain 6 n=1 Tax=Gekko gecko TaxID=36310 RepID=D9J340_GEKGE|nr:NADH dehydrogenase subunit 6 [Gekko gecko]
MAYLFFLLALFLWVGVAGVTANPSAVFGVGALILGAVSGCGILVGLGGSFVGLVLLLVYIGGMLVVFAYSIALVVEPHLESWLEYAVLVYFVGYLVVTAVLWYCFGESVVGPGVDSYGVFGLRSDMVGVALLFSEGGPFLLFAGWGLLLVLFVVLELVRGQSRGCLSVP